MIIIIVTLRQLIYLKKGIQNEENQKQHDQTSYRNFPIWLAKVNCWLFRNVMITIITILRQLIYLKKRIQNKENQKQRDQTSYRNFPIWLCLNKC